MKSLLTRARLAPIAEEEAYDVKPFAKVTLDVDAIVAPRRPLLRSHSGESWGLQTMHFVSMVFSVICIEICKGVLLRAVLLATLVLVLLVCHHWYAILSRVDGL
ncbi:hypothetical protein ACHHYP_20667 [Achlya hypogyna]|uniref:Transmembrane protein n=1 Tax=Achlya hypogyna TaxID=1202772 RepID=A0A1V9ZG51_ACHHY|nr:hypothetical protein ACHHYP_20667 [Achlya hypogyna]